MALDDNRRPGPCGPDPGSDVPERASPERLRARLAEAPGAFVTRALDNPALVVDHVLQILRNRAAPAAALTRIARRPEWTRLHDVKKGLVSHPRTAPAIARTLVHHLYWRDLAEVADDARLHPVLRRRAEELLRVRLAELSLGERIALARRAVRGLVTPLASLGESRVLRALLDNPRLVEGDVVGIARAAETPSDVLRALADHARWGSRLTVRQALLRNPRTPVHAALRVLGRLHHEDLRRIQKRADVPRVVRLGARRRLGLTP